MTVPGIRRLTLSITAGSVVGLLLTACTGGSATSSSGQSATPQKGGTLKLAGQGDIDFLDPTAGYNTDTHTLERA
ncbi:MAG: hypothetical protein JWN52_6193, partial [Actinomycetia bacterium]|nr:hypothetical protein [Actinomycetes bacterium]